MNLFGASQLLRVITTTAANLDIVGAHITYDGINAGVKAAVLQTIGAAATTTVVAAPGASMERNIYALSIRNIHASLANTITLQVFDGTNAFEIFKVTLAAGEQAIYDGIGNWRYLNAQGMAKLASSAGSMAPAINERLRTVLASDVINNNAVANTIADITGLSFSVLNGGKYHFRFTIDWTSAVNTTGARFSINGPTFSRLTYRSAYALSPTGDTVNNLGGYDQPAGANASPALVGGNLAIIEGMIQPSADGTVIGRFASEILSSAVTAKAGSFVEWLQVA